MVSGAIGMDATFAVRFQDGRRRGRRLFQEANSPADTRWTVSCDLGASDPYPGGDN